MRGVVQGMQRGFLSFGVLKHGTELGSAAGLDRVYAVNLVSCAANPTDSILGMPGAKPVKKTTFVGCVQSGPDMFTGK